ncbi:MAG: ankyrin repeat domain-containing protein, partial [Terriglobus roseus]|nr:ankyrin repeat domain-containing protein [Terriglobus roseus]
MLMQHHEDEALKAILPTLARRLNRSTDGPFMLNEAIRINQTGLMDMLLHAGFDPNKRDGHGLAPIHLAVKASNQSHAQALKDKGADIDAVCVQQDPDFYLPLVPEARLLQGMAFTPLLLAARYSQSPDMVRWLLKNGADPNRAIGSKEITVLHGMASSP